MKKVEFVERKRWVFFGLPWTFTKYLVNEEFITIQAGFLNRSEDDCFLYKVQDVRLTTSLFERVFGLGSIRCFTGDTTDPNLDILHIKNAKEIKDFILEASERERVRKRTVNALNIGTDDIDLL
ncbi:MAG: PH domain-containing protein [Eubacteriales bacterium]